MIDTLYICVLCGLYYIMYSVGYVMDILYIYVLCGQYYIMYSVGDMIDTLYIYVFVVFITLCVVLVTW